MSVKELAKGTVYTQAMETGWEPPSHIRALSDDDCEEVCVQRSPGVLFVGSHAVLWLRFGESGTSSWRAKAFLLPSAPSAK